MNKLHTLLLPLFLPLFALLFVGAQSCGGKSKKPHMTTGDAQTNDDQVLLKLDGAEDGLTILLSDGKDEGPTVVRTKIAPAEALSDARAQQILSRMPNIFTKKGDKTDFAFRERSLPPPRTGKSVLHAFPAKPSTAVAPSTSGPLEVSRFAPEGKVPLAPHVSVSFTQPMVAITSHADSIKNIPVTLSPQPEGRWRWVGTKTLLFDPSVRMPMATSYKVHVAKGTKSTGGQALASDVDFSFETPALTMQRSYPRSGPQELQPLIFIAFDQTIDADALLPSIKLEAKGSTHSVRQASEEEIQADKEVFAMVEAERKRDVDRRWIAVVPVSDLPKDANVAVTVAKGAPSAEGPLLTPSAQSFNFRTYGPFTINEARCGWGSDCPPGSPFQFEMSNPVDEEQLDELTIAVDPELARQKVSARGLHLRVQGNSLGRTTYEVTLPAALKDRFGQTLGKDTTRTFKVGDAQPQIFGPNGLTVADPAAKKPSVEVHSINVRSLNVQIYKVAPADWEAYGRFMRGNPRRPQPAPGKKVFDKNISVKGDADRMLNTLIDLEPALNKDGKGHAVVVVEPTNWPNRYKPRLQSWVQVTDIGLDAFGDATDLLAWTTDLATGKPLTGVNVAITHTAKKGTSDAKGLVTLELDRKSAGQGEHQVVLATKGSDSAFLPQNTYFWSDSSAFEAGVPVDRLQWFVFDDRGMYKPGEKVRVSGWTRNYQDRKGGDIAAIDGLKSIAYTVIGSRGNKITSGNAKITPAGSFELSFDLPKTANLGYARVELQASGIGLPGNLTTSHGFQIQEFRRPEFEVSSEVSQGPHIVGKGADVTVSAKYYAGGPLAGADVTWNVQSKATNFTPPNRDDFDFGSWVPWWGWRSGGGFPGQSDGSSSQSFQSKTDASGKQVLHMDFLSVKPPRPMSVTASASVMDVNRQAWATSSTLLVHPSDLYIGLKRDRYFVNKGEPIKLQGIVVDQEGKSVPARQATIRAVRLDWEYKKGEYKEVEKDPQVCTISSTDKAFDCEFQTPEGGTYKIIATVTDDLGRPNQTELTTWVSGGKQPPERNVVQEEVTLIPDKKDYQGGDTAKLLVQAPFYPAEGVLTIRRSGLVTTQVFHMKSATTTLEVAIKDRFVPNVYVQVDLVGSAPRVDDQGEAKPDLPRRPAYAMGQLRLSVPPTKRTLSVKVTPEQAKIAPGEKSRLSIEVLDASGKPAVGAEVTAIVVDEAVLALSDYQTPDPIAAFYFDRGAGVGDYHQRQWLKLARPDDASLLAADPTDSDLLYEGESGGVEYERSTSENMPAPMALAKPERKSASKESVNLGKMASGAANANAPIAIRTNFDALAAFAPLVKTDSKGKAIVEFKVPDNLTRYRIMVVAAAGSNHFGKGESNLTARLPLMVRPSPPRFLNFGDRFELPIVLQNQTDKDMSVELAVRASNAAITKGAGRKVTVPANDRVEVRFPAEAEMAGVARFQVAAASSSFQDANEFFLPVWTPATTEAFATYGEIDKGAISQPVRLPPGVVKEFGGLDISMSSTQLQALTDALLYLIQYPYECSEQTASRIMGVAALRDVLDAFKAEGMPSKAEIESAVARDIERLSSLQNWDGGFAFWLRGYESWPYVSIHAAHALSRAKDKGFKVPEEMLNRSKQYLQQIERHIPSYYGIKTRRMLIAYALYVRDRMGDSDPARAKKLFNEAGLKGLSMESIGWLMSVLHEDASAQDIRTKMHRYLDNKVSETAATANWVDGYADDAHLVLYSSRRADAVLLEALIKDKGKSDLIPKVVRGLLAHRVQGKWTNTQENVFVLLAMDAYFHAYENVTPNFVARMWLGSDFAGEETFKGRSTDRHLTHVPMAFLDKGKGDQDLVISKDGKGRLYYRIGMTYAPKDLKLEPADHGFAVERTYEAVDDDSDVKRLSDGSYQVKAGARVRVRLTMVAENRRYHVALVDPLPAGLEPMNPALAVTGPVPQDPKEQKSGGPFWWWSRPWFEHQNMRDERVEAFTSLLWSGVHNYSYVTRATTPGRFIVPPTKAEEMYFPETFGRSASDILIVQ